MPREPLPTWFFVLVAVRLGQRFLLVRERKHGRHWYLPAGRVEPGESLIAAAERETLEESGVPIVVDGLVRVEHTPMPDAARVRVIFSARPADDTPPKSVPDEESLGAVWASIDEIRALPLRKDEVLRICAHLARGGAVYPLGALTFEGAPFPAA
jgi:8-oxo-dGTP pyrophosphatase MutT (NUDIX family)